jgi:hypothetical protein
MDKDTALKLALEALDSKYIVGCSEWRGQQLKALIAIKEALAQPAQELFDTHALPGQAFDTHSRQPAQEPVAWMHVQGNYEELIYRRLDDFEIKRGWTEYPLYTTPPQRPWVGLMRGVRVEGDTVIISVKGGNDAARELCGALIKEMEA